MSSIVSLRPSFLNHSNEAFWMSIRLGRSRTCLRREKLLRARGAATPVVKLRGEGAEVVRALTPDPGVRVDEDRRRAGRLVGAAVLVRVHDRQVERRVAVGGVDAGGEDTLEHYRHRRFAARRVVLAGMVLGHRGRRGYESDDQGEKRELETH